MIIEFSVKNYKTFKDKATLSLVASNYDKDTRESENVINLSDKKLRLLKSAVVYGANASGKSKFFEALSFMKQFVISSSKDSQKGDEIKTDPFRLSTESENEPTEFEIVFIQDKIIYRYGFEVNQKEVVSEWLFYKPKRVEVQLFYREYQNFKIHTKEFKEANFLIKKGMVRDNALLLSFTSQFNEKKSIQIINLFRKLKIISGLSERGYKGFTMIQTQNPQRKKNILELLKVADFGINNIETMIIDIENLPKDMPDTLKDDIRQKVKNESAIFLSGIQTYHNKYDKYNKNIGQIEFSLEDDESNGTSKFFSLTGPVIDSLANGNILLVDEFETKMHPNLVCHIVALFNSKKSNPNNAQLIFNTHDTNLLNSGLFRRDQIWFIEKNKYGEANLYSLADFKTKNVRKKSAFEENYVRGKYGAVPYLADFEDFVVNEMVNQNEQ